MNRHMLSANDARILSNKRRDLRKDLSEIERLIREAALRGDRSIRVPYEMCDFDGYSGTFVADGLSQILLDNGYAIRVKNNERQFVDVWIEVSWH